jgi:hypothetical protein
MQQNPIALRALARHGFGDADRRAAITLLEQILMFEHAGDENEGVTEAIDTLDAWDERGIELVRLALTQYPEVRDALVGDLSGKSGHEAVLGVRKLLDRLDEFDTRPEAAEAMAHLRSRGFSPEDRARLRALVETAQVIDTSDVPVDESDYETLLIALEWSGFARLAIDRRDILQRLGLARGGEDGEGEGE